jgi:superfamily II DNA or RNA helicase
VSLPHIVKHIYNNATDEVVRRGKKIYSSGFVELIEHDELMSSIVFRVKDDSYSTFYKVFIQKYIDPKLLTLRCSCPYNMGDICRHETAALLRLQDMADKNLLGNSIIQYNQYHSVAKMKNIDLRTIKALSSPSIFEEAEKMLRSSKAVITKSGDERVEADLKYNGTVYPLVIQKNEERVFDTSCTCTESMHPLCEHKVLLFLQLLNAYGANYFDSIRNWDKEKNKLLQIYGYSLNDDLTGKFEFTYKEGKPFLKLLDTSIKRVATGMTQSESAAKPTSFIRKPLPEEQKEIEPVEKKKSNIRLGLVFNLNKSTYPFFKIDAVQGEYDEDGRKYINKAEVIDLTKYVNTDSFSDDDKLFFQQIRKLQDSEINKYLIRNSPFSEIWDNIIQGEEEVMPEETRALIAEYLHPKIKKIFQEENSSHFIFKLNEKKKFITANLNEIELSDQYLKPAFKVTVQGGEIQLSCLLKIGNKTVAFDKNEFESNVVFLQDDVLYTWEKTEDILHAEKFFSKQKINLNKEDWNKVLQEVILPLSREHDVEFDSVLTKEVKGTAPEIKLQLLEKGEYLVFQPIFNYGGYDTKPSEKPTLIIPSADKLLIIHRNTEAEENFVRELESLHSLFVRQQETKGLILKGAEVLRNNWFFLFVDAMKEKKVPVFGFEALRNFRFNTAKPKTNIHVSSGMDWFDAKIEIEFDSQKIGIEEIKKAIAAKQSFVQLGDGTLGILPDEWLKRYSLLFKVGEGKNEKLRLSRYHLSVIDELYENRDESEISFALDEKFEKLKSFKSIPDIPIPHTLTAVLRPYQIAGFNWLNYLNEVGWGGILADDMGLGKTVQALTMLDQFKQKNGGLKALVVCPTTLIYNWKNEVNKFTPELSYHIHHGNARLRNVEELTKHNIIITTYGTLRSDINLFLTVLFDYIVLDESQAIKNPQSKVTKAATLLTAKNRLCMSGTPLQNNTFDIFAQMNFLNPGLLGNMEFFRNEFATPIDKFGEPEQKEHLRKLLLPFILRRTKEQVAKDLPEKTETILFCEMEAQQRSVYEYFRNAFRDKILGAIDQQGIDKSQLTILQGLMKLRQICDSPAILNDEEKFDNHSIKLDELTREITENIGEHKVLIFSQFLGMLSLIREKMKEHQISYEYFDGSTSAPDRERAIQNFQNNDDCRVFLISLKAGGVGLNLTAADYVYIVDPWWNPAVEQQAIDRTHRIGQTKNIFAYRMICVDTIEDKIMQLQERKKTLAKELISDESGFVKSLTKEDVEYLFS